MRSLATEAKPQLDEDPVSPQDAALYQLQDGSHSGPAYLEEGALTLQEDVVDYEIPFAYTKVTANLRFNRNYVLDPNDPPQDIRAVILRVTTTKIVMRLSGAPTHDDLVWYWKVVAPGALEQTLDAPPRYILDEEVVHTTGNETVAGIKTFSDSIKGKLYDKGGTVYHVKAYGLLGDDSFDNKTVLQALVTLVKAAGGGIIQFDAGTFRISGPILEDGMPSVVIRGVGRGATMIKSTIGVGVSGLSDGTIFQFSDSTKVTFEHLTLDNNNIETTANITSLILNLETPTTCYYCDFINLRRNGLAVRNTSLEVVGCTFQRDAIENDYENVGIKVYSIGEDPPGTPIRSGPIILERNSFEGLSMQIDGDDCKIVNNNIDGFGYGAGIVINVGSTRGVVSGNTVTGGAGVDSDGFIPGGIEVNATPMTIANNMIHNNEGHGIILGVKRINVVGNIIWDNGCFENQTVSAGIVNNYQGVELNASYSTISGNIVMQIEGSFQAYGFADSGAVGETNGIKFVGNNFIGNTIGEYTLAATSNDYTFDNPKRFSSAWTPGTIGAGAAASLGITTSDISPGDFVQASLSIGVSAALILGVNCYTPNAVVVSLFNPTGSPISVGALTAYVRAEKRPF